MLTIKATPARNKVTILLEGVNTDTKEIRVFESETEFGPWTQVPFTLNGGEVGKTYASKLFAGSPLFFKVQVFGGGAMEHEEIGQFEDVKKEISKSNSISDAIVFNFKRYLDAANRTNFFIFRRIQNSEFCICYNETRMESEDPDCDICGGAGTILGWHFAGETRMEILTPHANEVLTKELFGEMTIDTSQVQAWTVPEPSVLTQDIVVDTTNFTAYEVIGVNLSKRQNYTLRQGISLRRLVSGSPFYRFLPDLIAFKGYHKLLDSNGDIVLDSEGKVVYVLS